MAARGEDDVKVRQIRDAARELFLRHGYAGVSTATLAKQAGISKETLYSRYPNKEAVLTDLLEHLVRISPAEPTSVEVVTTRAELEQGLVEFARNFTSLVMQPDYVELVRIVIAESPRMPHVGQVLRKAVPERALREVASMLAEGKRAGTVSEDVDLTIAARMFVAPLAMPVLANRLLVAPPESDSATAGLDIEAHVELFLNGICPRN